MCRRNSTEPFLQIEEIENQIRLLLDDKLHLEDIQNVCNKDGNDKKNDHLDDLTFGDYIRLIENPEHWDTLGFKTIDRKTLVELLKQTNDIRNNLMHFEPEGLSQEDLSVLDKACNLLGKITHYHCQAKE